LSVIEVVLFGKVFATQPPNPAKPSTNPKGEHAANHLGTAPDPMPKVRRIKTEPPSSGSAPSDENALSTASNATEHGLPGFLYFRVANTC
jgi:hypothetical protein